MRFRNSALGMLIVMTVVSGAAEGHRASTWEFKTDYVVDTTGIGRMLDPVWSTDGRFLAARGTQKGLFIHDRSSRRTSTCVTGPIGRTYVWLPGNKLVYTLVKPYGYTYTAEIHAFDVPSRTDKTLLIFPFGLETDMQATGDGRVALLGKHQIDRSEGMAPRSEWKGGVVDTNGVWTPIDQASTPPLTWEEYGVPYIRKNGTTRLIIVDGPGQLWDTKGSPHGTYLSVVTKADYDKQTVIATARGTWVKLLPYGFRASQWSRDDQLLLGVDAKQDSYSNTLVGSKLAIFDLANQMYSLVEMTPDQAPINPVWNETTGEVTFYDLQADFIVVGTLSETK